MVHRKLLQGSSDMSAAAFDSAGEMTPGLYTASVPTSAPAGSSDGAPAVSTSMDTTYRNDVNECLLDRE